MMRIGAAIWIAILTWTGLAQAQDQGIAWVQVEARPTLAEASQRARDYAASLPDVNGFRLDGGWYGIVLGPYYRDDAERVLEVYRSEGRIPRDSYIQLSSALGQQFWPIGANILERGSIVPEVEDAPEALPEPEPSAEAPLTTLPERSADETPEEARRSEARLSGSERRQLQIALRWAGYYDAAIDGAFGRGTRSSMAQWQAANGFETTGVLTTAQRAALLEQYNAPLTSVGMEMVRDDRAGIEIAMPLGAVGFTRYEPPFAEYDATGDLGARVLLISQPGTRTALYGLYDIMQTLDIVPLDGPRERGQTSFTLEGRNDRIVSYTEARLEAGQIKGFTLIWPAGDDARRTRVLDEMKASFRAYGGALDLPGEAGALVDIDLMAGLSVRKPRLSRSGFYVDRSGTVVTASEAVEGCRRITLDSDVEASLVAEDRALGVAVLRPAVPLAPAEIARFAPQPPRLKSDVAVAGYSFGGVLGAPTLTFGALADTSGLMGETELDRLDLAAQPGDAGGPVLAFDGAVTGMLLPRPDRGRQLPGEVSFAADADAVRDVLTDAGFAGALAAPDGRTLSAPELTRLAEGMTVLVGCWD
jgi:hypothetical protein